MKPSYFQNAQIEKTFERQCNCESKLNQLLWNEFLIITLPLICWSSPRVKDWPHTHFLKWQIFFFAAYHLEYSETKLFCLPWKYFSEQLFTYPWLISHKKWKVSLIFLSLKYIISAVGMMISESEYSSTPTEKSTFYKIFLSSLKRIS